MENKILLIEDVPDMPSELALFLFNSGYHVLNIGNIEDSFEIIQSHLPELIIVNNISENNDQGMFQNLKTAAGVQTIVIFTSENMDHTDRLTALPNTVADGYFVGELTGTGFLSHLKLILTDKNKRK